MEEYRDRMEREEPENPSGTSTARWLAIAAGTAIVAACLAVGYGYHQQTLVGQLTGKQEQMTATVGQLQGQIESLTGKLNEVTTAQQAAAAAAAQANTPAAKQAAGKRSAVENKRLKELQARMEDQQKQLKATQDDVAKTRSDPRRKFERDAGRFERVHRQDSRGTRRPPKTGRTELRRIQPAEIEAVPALRAADALSAQSGHQAQELRSGDDR